MPAPPSRATPRRLMISEFPGCTADVQRQYCCSLTASSTTECFEWNSTQVSMDVPLPEVLLAEISTRSSATAEIARVGGHYAVRSHSRSLTLVTVESPFMPDVAQYWSTYRFWTSLYRLVWKLFPYLEPFRRGPRVWWTDGQTEPLLA